MTLSIVIVNYNVAHFLKECIGSIYRSDFTPDMEIIVVDNASTDHSKELISRHYPEVRWVQNTENRGFSKACNQGAALSKGDYILFLNPDTLLTQDTLQKTHDFASSIQNFGALGVKMIDGSGRYLQESKRSVPTIWDSFTKMTGLYKLAPESAFLNGYYQGHLSSEETHEVTALAGAFIMVSREAWEAVGGFDERYFMYSEDIDLGLSIHQAGYGVYYYADAQIIHFKGESTKKSGYRFNRSFYESMILFMEKYKGDLYSASSVLILRWLVAILGVYSFIKRKIGQPVGILLLIAGLYGLQYLLAMAWAIYMSGDTAYFPQWVFTRWLVLMTVVWTTFYLAYGWFTSRRTAGQILRSQATATVLLLLVYSLMPEAWRSSRFLVVGGGIVSFAYFMLITVLKNKSEGYGWQALISTTRPTVLVGNDLAFLTRYADSMRNQENMKILGFISDQTEAKDSAYLYLGGLEDLPTIQETRKPELVLFDVNTISMGDIINRVQSYEQRAHFGLITDDNKYLGSPNRNRQGEYVTLQVRLKIEEEPYRLAKRAVDVVLGVFVLSGWPLYALIGKGRQSIKGFWDLVTGRTSVVGWHKSVGHLPPQSGLIMLDSDNSSLGFPNLSDMRYVQDYRPWWDLLIYFKNWKHI